MILLFRPDDVSIPVRVEPFDMLRTGFVETLLQAQGERFIVHKAGSIDSSVKRLDSSTSSYGD
jgi:hypothetical protein